MKQTTEEHEARIRRLVFETTRVRTELGELGLSNVTADVDSCFDPDGSRRVSLSFSIARTHDEAVELLSDLLDLIVGRVASPRKELIP